jgi:hypothetical protein
MEDGSFCVNTLCGEINDKDIVALTIYIPDDCDDKHYQNMAYVSLFGFI